MKPWHLAVFLLIFDAIALAILYPHIDFFSCGYLLFSTFLAIFQASVHGRFSSSPEISKTFYAQHLDFLWDKLVPVLGGLELLVFVEYAHRWLPFDCVWRNLQVLGLLLLLLATVWLVWVDRYFLRNFEVHYQQGKFMTDGPFRYLRHPRYAGLALTRLSLTFIFGNFVAVLLTLTWFWLIHRRVRLEEAWLTSRFGDAYKSYAARTPSFL